jgi:hypothetical protein
MSYKLLNYWTKWKGIKKAVWCCNP